MIIGVHRGAMRKLSEVRHIFAEEMKGVDKCLGKIPRQFKEMISIRSVSETCSFLY